MAPQPFVGTWPHIEFLDRYDSLDGGSARSEPLTYTQNPDTYIHTHTHTDIHASSGIRIHDSSV
jgi:hypothetical protein